MADDIKEDNVLQFPELKDKRYILGCPHCDGTAWLVIMSEDQIRFEVENSDGDMLDVAFQPDNAPIVATECMDCGYQMDMHPPLNPIH